MIDVIELLTSQGIDFSDHGHYLKFKCINPAHEDATPSMTVLKESGYARCWSCGARYSYGQLVYALTGNPPFKTEQDKYSFRFNNSLVTVSKRTTFKKKERKFTMSGELKDPFKNKEVMKYLHSIGVSDQTIQDFDIKYMLKGSMSFIEDSKSTPVYNRICIPLYEDNKIVNYECRDFTGKGRPKVLYPKGGKSDILFNKAGLDFDRPLYIVEGIKSALRLYSLGWKNTTAVLGASVGRNQLYLINQMKHPIIFPDNDTAGWEMVKYLDENTTVDLYITYMKQEGYDPADGTIDELEKVLYNPISLVEYYMRVYDVFGSTEFKGIEW